MVIRFSARTAVRVVLILATAILVALSEGLFQASTSAESEPSLLQRADRKDLCVTNGAITHLPPTHMAIETPSVRAVLRTQTAPAAALRFR
jgi:hypothetical protein